MLPLQLYGMVLSMRTIIKKIWHSEIFKFLLGIVLMLVVSALIAFNALLLWVATGPRSLDAVTPYIESALSDTDGNFNVKIGETRLIWDGWRHPVDIRLKDVSVLTGEGKTFTVFPEIELGIDVLYLPLGRIMPTSLVITSPTMNIVQNDDHSFGFGFKQENEETTTVPLPAVLAPLLSQSDDSNFRRLHTVIIKDAGVNVLNSRQKVFFNAHDFNLVFNRNRRGAVKVGCIASIDYEDNSSVIRSEFSLKPNQPTIDGLLEFSEVKPDILAGLFTSNPEWKSFAVPVSGKVSMALDTGGTLQSFEFAIRGSKGSIASDKLVAPLPVNSLDITGAVGNGLSEIRLDALNADIDGMQLSASGRAKFFDSTSEPDSSPEISANILLKDIPVGKVKMLWPPSLSPMTREWVTENITEGIVVQDQVIIDLKKGDLKKPVLPKESIDATIDAEGLKIRYLPEHPQATNVKSKIHIDGVSLAADIESADFLEKTKLSNGHVTIDDLNVDNPYINVELHAEAPARDMVHFLGLPRLKHSGHLGLDEGNITGNVNGEAKVGFNFFAPKGQKAEDVISYAVKAEIENISQKDFLHKFDVVNANGTVNVDNSGVEFTGSGEVNGAKANNSKVRYLFKPEKGVDTFLEFTASIAAENLKRFGYPEFPFLKGNLDASAKVKLGNNLEQTDANINLTGADINFDKIAWKKPVGEPVKLAITTEKKDGVLKINSFNISGSKVAAKGSATLANNYSDFTDIHLSEFTLGNNDIANLSYEQKDDITNLNIRADSLDLTNIMEKNSDGFSFQNFPPVKLKADIGKLIIGNERIVSNFNGEISCDKTICNSADLTGKSGDGKAFSIKIFNDARQERKIAVRADDAGSFLHDFGILDGMNGGGLVLYGIYQENGSGSTLNAKLTISEHTIKNAPILGKILALASLTGLIDTLQGNGIRFKALNIPFTLHNDVATLEKGKTYGSAIGITVDGTITFPKKILDLQGTVVPSYTLNNFFGKVPLLGEMLTGGDGQGVFAARYSIKGPESKADVSVNPLSILTPGFLRGLFDIFDDQKEEGQNTGN